MSIFLGQSRAFTFPAIDTLCKQGVERNGAAFAPSLLIIPAPVVATADIRPHIFAGLSDHTRATLA
jgi:hypothetical protein